MLLEQDALARLLGGESALQTEAHRHRKDGTVFRRAVYLHALARGRAGRRRDVDGDDISERKTAERAREHALASARGGSAAGPTGLMDLGSASELGDVVWRRPTSYSGATPPPGPAVGEDAGALRPSR